MNKIIDLLGLSEFKEKIISLIPTKISQLDNDSEYAKKEEINDLKKSVSDGKKLVADAITDKGVETAADAEFATMADNIEQIETSSKIVLQGNKDVHPTTSIQVIKPDNGYDGLSQVTLDKIQAETKTVTPSAGNTTYYPNTGRFFSSVTVNAVPTQTKTVNPTTVSQTVKPDTGKWLSQVTVNAMKLQEVTASIQMTDGNPAGYAGLYPDSGYDGLSKVNLPIFKTQSKTVTPTTVQQTITPDSGKNALSSVVVNAAKLQNKSVTPTSSIQTIYPDSGFLGLSAVSVAAISSDSNVKSGTVNFGASGTTVNISIGFTPKKLFLTSSDKFIIYDPSVSTSVIYARVSNSATTTYSLGATNSPIQTFGSTTTLKAGIVALANVSFNWYAIG